MKSKSPRRAVAIPSQRKTSQRKTNNRKSNTIKTVKSRASVRKSRASVRKSKPKKLGRPTLKCQWGDGEKYTKRPSPRYSAALCPHLERRGNDGYMYKSVRNSANVFTWKLIKDEKRGRPAPWWKGKE